MAFGVFKERLFMIYSSALSNVLLGRLISFFVDLFHSVQVFKLKFFLKIDTFMMFCLPGYSFSDIDQYQASAHWQRWDKEQINYSLSPESCYIFVLTFLQSMKTVNIFLLLHISAILICFITYLPVRNSKRKHIKM